MYPDPLAEQTVQRHQTTAFVAGNRIDVVIKRNVLVYDGSGGFRVDDTPSLEPQSVNLIKTQNQLPVRETVDGQEVTPAFVIIAEHNADIQRGDYFFIDGARYDVVFVQPDRSYEVSGEVTYRG